MPTPNIVFCHVDQMHHQAISALGNPHVATPAFDEIMQAGTSFTQAQASHPLCCPSRTSWYTGRMPSEHGTISNGMSLDKTMPDLGMWMGARGYDCYYAGKWHVPGRQPETGFKVLHPHYHMGERGDEGCAAMAEQFLMNYKGDQPFFLNVGFLNPHDCCYMSQPGEMPCMKFGLEKVFRDEMPPAPPGYDPRRSIGQNPEAWNTERVRLQNYIYYRMVEMADEVVGRVYRALRHSRFARKTVFIFSSDHGEMMGHKNKFGKNLLNESALRVPLVIVAPDRVAANAREDCPTVGLDVTATILDFAGVEALPGMSIGRSLRPILEKKAQTLHDYVASETSVRGPHVSIRRGKSKSIIDVVSGRMELYDTAADPWEMKDLSTDSSSAGTVADHRAMLADYQKRVQYGEVYRRFLTDPEVARKADKGDEI